jgi:hypothetical protein
MPKATSPVRVSRSASVRRRRGLAQVNNPVDAYVNALDGLPESYITCRELHHTWKVSSGYIAIDTTERDDRLPRLGMRQYVERRLVCTRCKTIRSDAYALEQREGWTALRKLNSTYKRPEGYSIKGVSGTFQGRGELLRGLLYDRAQEQQQ